MADVTDFIALSSIEPTAHSSLPLRERKANILKLLRDPFTYLQREVTEAAEKDEPYIAFDVSGNKLVILLDPKGITRMLNDVENFNRDGTLSFLQRHAGGSIFFTSSEEWLAQKKEAQRFFTKGMFEKMQGEINGATDRLYDSWRRSSANFGKPILINDQFSPYTLEILFETLFHMERPGDIKNIRKALNLLFAVAARRQYNPKLEKIVSHRFLHRWGPRVAPAVRFMQGIVDGVIDQRLQELQDPAFEHRDDLLSTLVKGYLQERAVDNSVGGAVRESRIGKFLGEHHGGVGPLGMFSAYSRNLLEADPIDHPKDKRRLKLQQEILAFLVAGHDTTATALSWVFYILARYPEVQKKVFAEIDQAFHGEDPKDPRDLMTKLPYTKQVIDETLRHQPSFWGIRRKAQTDIEIALGDGQKLSIKKGTVVMVPILFMQELEKFWGPDALKFDPGQFDAEVARARSQQHGTVYLPFGDGQRACLGRGLAMIEIYSAIVGAAQRFRFDLRPGSENPGARKSAMYKPRRNIYVRFQPREAISART
jgi:cytochrome P450